MFRTIFLLPVFSALLFAGESGWGALWTPHFIFNRETAAAGRQQSVDFEKIFRQLRDGEQVERALSSAYGLRTPAGTGKSLENVGRAHLRRKAGAQAQIASRKQAAI
jgi:hypothetical protein